MKRTLSSLALIAATMLASAAPRTEAEALMVARQFAAKTISLQHVRNMKMTLSTSMAANAKSRDGIHNALPNYYIVNIGDNNGFVVVSGDDRFKDVLGYSVSGCVSSEQQLPDALQYWLDFLSDEMDAALAAGYEAPASKAADSHTQSVEPLLTTKWNQNSPYNNKIPNYATGCVATGMAQVMNYWKYPVHGVGSHTNGYFANHSADFGATTYDWANMKDEYGGKFDTKAQVDAVSTLMYHLGIATDMRWASPSEGSATPNMYAGNAFINFFGYNKYLYAEQRDCMSLGAWKALVIDQLKTGHPICYAGLTGKTGAAGHFFILDGYDASTGLFHFNWGWAGMYDGYYNISALEPGEGGIGAGAGSYNYEQQIFVNVQPTEVGEYVAHFDAKEVKPQSLTSSKSDVTFSTISLVNNSLNFKGSICLAIYDTNGTLVKCVTSNKAFPTGFNPGHEIQGAYDFDMDLSDVADGDYVVCLATQHNDYPGKAYPIRAYYGKPTYYTMKVSGSKVTFAEQNTDYYLADAAAPLLIGAAEENTVYQNKQASFQITLKNTGTTAFYDEVGICIKKGRDSNPQYITVPCSLAPGEEKTLSVWGTIIREPGSYTLYACYGDNGTYTTLDNSVSLTVKDEASAVASVAAETSDAPIYTISGIRVSKTSRLQPGIYIQNGNKLLVK